MLKRHFQPVYHLTFILCLLLSHNLSATPLDPHQVPAPLQPWVDWVLHDEKELDCPWYYNRQQRSCQWPATLNLQLNEQGGSFSQQWQIFNESYVRLPGDNTHWPQDVSNKAGEKLLIEERNGFPTVMLNSGTHTLNGTFRWNKLPKALRVTPTSGLIALSVNDKAIEHPNFNQQGQLWLTQGKTENTSEDNLDVQVFRKVIDSHPIQVVTSIKLRASGKQRNVILGPVLLEEFIPLSINSPLPARMVEQQQIQVQLRPGEWTLEIVGRAAGDQTIFTLPDSQSPWPQQEVWVLQTDSSMRQVEVSGVNSIDPNQTRLPPDWKTLPAYLMTPQASLTLDVIHRGAAQTGKQQLSLRRESVLVFTRQTQHVRNHPNGYLTGKLRDDLHLALFDNSIDHLMADLLNRRQKVVQLLTNELTCNDVTQATMLVTIAVLQQIGTEHMTGTKLIRTIRFVDCPVIAVIILEHAIHIRIARDDPSIVKAVMKDRMVIAELLINRKGIPLKLRRIKNPWIQVRSKIGCGFRYNFSHAASFTNSEFHQQVIGKRQQVCISPTVSAVR